MKGQRRGLNSESVQGHSGWLSLVEFGSLAVTASQVFDRESLRSEMAHG